MGKTNVVLDNDLIAKCRQETGIRTIRALIDHALHELLRHKRQKKVLELKGKIHWEGNLDDWRKGTGIILVMVDTTVWVDLFRGEESSQVKKLEQFLAEGEDVCICGVILTEILQGIRNESEYTKTLALFDSFLFLPMDRSTFVRAAKLYRTLRRQGVTIRNTVDCMIASVAIEQNIPLLHNDKDFSPIEQFCGLKTISI